MSHTICCDVSSLHHMPVLVTLAFMEGSNDPIFIVDPTRQEETVSTGQVSLKDKCL